MIVSEAENLGKLEKIDNDKCIITSSSTTKCHALPAQIFKFLI